MRQRILGSHTPRCHKRMVITTLFSMGGGGGVHSIGFFMADHYVHIMDHMSFNGCRVLSTTQGSLHVTTGAASDVHKTALRGWHAIGHRSDG